MGQTDSPWQGKTVAELGHDHSHDARTCPVCAPLNTEAGRAGAARAHVRREFL